MRAHVFLCMLAYYVEWHLRHKLAPLLFDDHEPEAAERESVVAPAQPSPAAKHKARTKRTEADQPVHSLRTLLDDLATITKNRVVPRCPVHNPSRSSRDRPSCRAPCSGCSACGCEMYPVATL